MSNSDEVKPALTAEEWGNEAEMNAPGIRTYHRDVVGYRDNEFRCFPWGVAMDVTVPARNGVGVERARITAETPRERHALAALALHGQPYGFTREDVATLRTAIGYDPTVGYLSDALESLADRIAALLPPEPTDG